MRELNESLVMTTCKCRENNNNLVMTRAWFEEMLSNKIAEGASKEQDRIIKLLEELEAVGSDPTTFDYIDTVGLIALIKRENK